jgi:NADH-quinone oxidoreductase subunit G
VNAQGLAQSFKGTVTPLAQTRPGWKVLRVLGNILHLNGFEEESSEAVRDAVLSGSVQSRLSNQIQAQAEVSSAQAAGVLQRVTDTPIYRTDAIVRRAEALQASEASRAPVARMHPDTMVAVGVTEGAKVRVRSTTGQVELIAEQDLTLPAGAVRVAAGFEQTAALGSAFGQLNVERA